MHLMLVNKSASQPSGGARNSDFGGAKPMKAKRSAYLLSLKIADYFVPIADHLHMLIARQGHLVFGVGWIAPQYHRFDLEDLLSTQPRFALWRLFGRMNHFLAHSLEQFVEASGNSEFVRCAHSDEWNLHNRLWRCPRIEGKPVAAAIGFEHEKSGGIF